MRPQSAASAGEIEGNETLDVEIPPEDIPPEDIASDSERPYIEPTAKKVTDPIPPRRGKAKAESKPPGVDEWQDFFGRIVLKALLEGYTAWMFREFEDEISPQEWARVKVPKEVLLEMAAPFATLANKSTFANKHGRTIIAATDSYEAIISLGIWMRRVNKIAAKHRKEKAPVINLAGKRDANNGPDRPDEQPRPDGRGNNPGIRVHNPGTG